MQLEMERRLRILHCPWNVAGQPAALAAAERSLGFDSQCIALHETESGFDGAPYLTQADHGRFKTELARYRLLWRALTEADVIHFSFGQSCLVPNAYPGLADLSWREPWRWPLRAYARLIWLKDLPLLRAAGKAIFVSWQGDDARQYDRSLELFQTCIAREVDARYYPPGSDHWKRQAIDRFSRYAHRQYALNPDLLHILPRDTRFLPYASFDPATVTPRFPDAKRHAPLRLLHAPSHRGAKGTAYILGAVEALRREGYIFNFELVEQQDRSAALARYETADVVIDQLLAGWYGGLGAEAMALGKVVIAYLRESDLGVIPGRMRAELPVVSACPLSITDVLRQILTMPRAELAMIGRAGRDFAEQWHNPLQIAKHVTNDYEAAIQAIRATPYRRHKAGTCSARRL